ncbi:MAG: methyltransferase domain-containing protein [bacterium]|nr:methyltransferase domain-containing protein [bacterium]
MNRIKEWLKEGGFSDFDRFVREHNFDFIIAMKEHYRRGLYLADKQKMCLNPNFPKNVLPKEIEDLSMSILNPLSLTKIKEGSFILDVGCGAGVDCFLASKTVGTKGLVIGIDPTEILIERANFLKDKYKISNVEFKIGNSDPLPFEDNFFDIITMNYSFHLVKDKLKSLVELKRVLKPDGQIVIGDSFMPSKIGFVNKPEEWFYRAGGAVSPDEFQEIAKKAGFRECSFTKKDYPELPELIAGYMVLTK